MGVPNGHMGQKHADHILDSKQAPLTIKRLNWTKPASDHAPIYAELMP
jgi:endonuclease/exonuclease/phosphatase family metal-dependent hydrolase